MKTHSIKRTDEETNDLLNKCDEQENKGGSAYPGMTYEQGIRAGINWIVGNQDENPLE